MSQGSEQEQQPYQDADSEPNSPAGAASPQSEQAADKEQAEGEPGDADRARGS
jgi:hypothetical protein